MLQGPSPITHGLQDAHKTERDSGTVRLVRRKPPPAFDSGRVVLLGFPRLRLNLQRLGVNSGDPVSLTLEPALETGGSVDEEPVKERASIQG